MVKKNFIFIFLCISVYFLNLYRERIFFHEKSKIELAHSEDNHLPSSQEESGVETTPPDVNYSFSDQEELIIKITPSKENYYLSNQIGLPSIFDRYFDDYTLNVDDIPVLHFTKINGRITDFYFFVPPGEKLIPLKKIFLKQRPEIDAISPEIFSSLIRYESTEPNFPENGVHREVEILFSNDRHTDFDLLRNIYPSLERKVDVTLYRYLRSNGIKTLEELQELPELSKQIFYKFFNLSTTCFFREWNSIGRFVDYLGPLQEAAKNNNRPLKLKIYGCSTGEEVLSFAIQLHESGINDFYILASDINDVSLQYTAKMQYPDSVVFAEKEYIKEKYFEFNRELELWEIKDLDFFKSRIKFINHNILNKLPGNLDSNFAPPYDIVSMMNILLYLENLEIQKIKDYWVQILNPKGILILHDELDIYTISNGSLGKAWSSFYFDVVNNCISVRR